jgi:NAD(P)-dependent dehydrogenase (short-subunit alcohol dehydrogenase family)
MRVKLRPLSEQVLVITGASSGIGLATAEAAAAAGAKVVLTARSRHALAHAVDRIKQQGGEAAFVVADVAVEADLEAAAQQAIDRFGRIDTWVNNAGVGVWGMIDEISEDDMRQLFETNFWGVVHGSRVALRHLARDGGAIINVGSVASERAFPVQGIYSASKHAVKGFTDALRVELQAKRVPLSVTLIKPASMGTPLPQHVRNYGEREARLPPPVYAPEEVARTILRAAARPVRSAYVGGGARATGILAALAPRLVDWVSAKFLIPMQYGDRPARLETNLYEGSSEALVRGDPRGRLVRPSLYSRASRHPAASLAAVGAAAAGAGLFLWNRREAKDAGTQQPAEHGEELLEAHPT